jgi:hypothetical protein
MEKEGCRERRGGKGRKGKVGDREKVKINKIEKKKSGRERNTNKGKSLCNNK